MKFDLPEPFGPMTRLIGLNVTCPVDAMLLKPSIAIQLSSCCAMINLKLSGLLDCSLPPRIPQPHRQVKHRLSPLHMIHPIRHKVPMPFKLKLLIRRSIRQ